MIRLWTALALTTALGCGGADPGPFVVNIQSAVPTDPAKADSGPEHDAGAAAVDADAPDSDVPETCLPLTCNPARPQCGKFDDGCGGSIVCSDGCQTATIEAGDPPMDDAGVSPDSGEQPASDAGAQPGCLSGSPSVACATVPPAPGLIQWSAPECCSGTCRQGRCAP